MRFAAAAGLLVALWASPSIAATPCPPGDDDWTEKERSYWSETLCHGEVLDFYDAKAAACLPATQSELSPDFLRDLVRKDPYREILRRIGLRIQCAVVKEPLDLARARLDDGLWLEACLFEDRVDLNNLRAGRGVSLDGSSFMGDLEISGSRVDGNLYLRDVRVDGKLGAYGIRVADNLYAARYSCDDEDVRIHKFLAGSAKIGGDVVLSSQSGFAAGPAIDEIFLTGSRIQGRLRVAHCTQIEDAQLGNMSIGSDLYIEGATIERLNLTQSRIGENLRIVGSRIGTKRENPRDRFPVDLTAARVGGAIRTWGNDEIEMQWLDPPRLEFLSVGLVDLRDAWPKGMLIGGIEFDRFYPLEAERMVEWIGISEDRPPGAYARAAQILEVQGKQGEAEIVAKAGLDRRLHVESSLFRSSVLWLNKFLFDYGYNPLRATALVLGLILVGWAVVRFSACDPPPGVGRIGFWFSLDRFLPFVKLREEHYEIELPTGVRIYFYLHQLAGYFIATVVVASWTSLFG